MWKKTEINAEFIINAQTPLLACIYLLLTLINKTASFETTKISIRLIGIIGPNLLETIKHLMYIAR